VSKRKGARPKGKKFYPMTFTLSQEQIDFLQAQPNASELVRTILDDLIASKKDIEQELGVISLNNQLKQLEQEKQKLSSDRFEYVTDNKKHWKTTVGDDGQTYIVWADEKTMTPTPLDNEDAKVAFRVLKGYDDAITNVEKRIADLKKQILQSE